MLRITVRNQTGIRIVLEGKLASVWVNELKNCCKDVLSRSDPGKVSLELADVSFVDAGGKRFLAELSHEGVHNEKRTRRARSDCNRASARPNIAPDE
jgi:ABC-type transporter Mla MlaB component